MFIAIYKYITNNRFKQNSYKITIQEFYTQTNYVKIKVSKQVSKPVSQWHPTRSQECSTNIEFV